MMKTMFGGRGVVCPKTLSMPGTRPTAPRAAPRSSVRRSKESGVIVSPYLEDYIRAIAAGFLPIAKIVLGTVISLIVAYAVVGWFVNWVRSRGFVSFAIYRLIVGTAVLVWVAGR